MFSLPTFWSNKDGQTEVSLDSNGLKYQCLTSFPYTLCLNNVVMKSAGLASTSKSLPQSPSAKFNRRVVSVEFQEEQLQQFNRNNDGH